jgi:hypothetical protein
VTGRRLGIVGLGAIGTALAMRAAAFRMRVAWHGPRPKADISLPYVADLESLARDSDVLAICCAGGPATRHLVNARVLDALGPQGVLVNVARGSIVDTAALIEALRGGSLAARRLMWSRGSRMCRKTCSDWIACCSRRTWVPPRERPAPEWVTWCWPAWPSISQAGTLRTGWSEYAGLPGHGQAAMIPASAPDQGSRN